MSSYGNNFVPLRHHSSHATKAVTLSPIHCWHYGWKQTDCKSRRANTSRTNMSLLRRYRPCRWRCRRVSDLNSAAKVMAFRWSCKHLAYPRGILRSYLSDTQRYLETNSCVPMVAAKPSAIIIRNFHNTGEESVKVRKVRCKPKASRVRIRMYTCRTVVWWHL